MADDIKSPYFSPGDAFKSILDSFYTGIEGSKDYLGEVFIGNDGKKYTIAEATIKEVELNSDVEYRRVTKEEGEDTIREIVQKTERLKSLPSEQEKNPRESHQSRITCP